MNNLNTGNYINNSKEQREKLLELNQDLLFGVYSLIENDEFKQTIKLELCGDVLTCYPNQLQNIKGLSENSEITILDLNSLLKGEIKVLYGKNVNIHRPVLLSNGVIDYIIGNIGKKHIITTVRDDGVINIPQRRTTTAGRNIGSNLHIEVIREHIEECPFLGKNASGEYVLATLSKKPEDLKILIEAINHFITQKHNLDRTNPNDIDFIKAFERNFPGIKYEELGDILKDIVKNNRFMQYYLKDGSIEGLEADTTRIEISEEKKVQSSGDFFTFFDKANNTIQYRKIQEISGFEQGFTPISNRPGRLFLESRNQYPRIPRIEQSHITQKLVPTIQYISQKVHFLVNRNDLEISSGKITSKQKNLEELTRKIRLDIEKSNGKSIVFDIDGVLIEAGLEVGDKQNISIEDYIEGNKEIILKIRKVLKKLSLKGYEIILCTGRGDDFATKVGDMILGGKYDKIISEGGVLIKDKNGKIKVCEGLEDNSRYINMIKETLIKYVKSVSGYFEEGKEYVLSFNPPIGIEIIEFKEKLLSFLSLTFPGFEKFLLITNSQTAVDILPLGTDKIIALNQVIGGKYMIYFGDSNNDIPALKESQLGIIPANAKEDFKENVRNFGNITFTTQSQEIGGVLEGLDFINNF